MIPKDKNPATKRAQTDTQARSQTFIMYMCNVEAVFSTFTQLISDWLSNHKYYYRVQLETGAESKLNKMCFS